MSTQSVNGHAGNVANFEALINICLSYGVKYNPAREAISIPQLKAVYSNATDAMEKMKNSKNDLDKLVNLRSEKFSEIKKLATRIINALDSLGADKGLMDDAKFYNRKIQGKRAKSIPKHDVPPPAEPGASNPEAVKY